jgi:hypothetical protein
MAKTIIIKGSNAAPSALPGQRGIPLRVSPIYGIWAMVIKRNSGNDKGKKTIGNTVDVETSEGYQITNVPVLSKEWVTLEKNDKGKFLGERDLPPEKALVFIIMPSGNLDSAFIIGSGFISSFAGHSDEFLVADKELEKLTNTEGNWTKKYDKVTGDLEIVGTDEDDKTLTLTIKKSEKKVQLKDWNDNDILIDEKGTSLTDTKGNKVVTDDSGIKMEDKNGNKSTMNSSGMKAEDKNGNIMEMAAAGTTMTAKKAKITGGMLEVNGTVAPTGSGPLCAVPVCPFGFPHVGNLATGT